MATSMEIKQSCINTTEIMYEFFYGFKYFNTHTRAFIAIRFLKTYALRVARVRPSFRVLMVEKSVYRYATDKRAHNKNEHNSYGYCFVTTAKLPKTTVKSRPLLQGQHVRTRFVRPAAK